MTECEELADWLDNAVESSRHKEDVIRWFLFQRHGLPMPERNDLENRMLALSALSWVEYLVAQHRDYARE